MMNVVPGLLIAFALAVTGNFLADRLALSLGLGAGAISGIMVAILLGLALGNLLKLPAALKPGISFAVKRVLRLGIVLLGLKLSIVEVGSIGLKSLPVIMVTIPAAILIVTYLGRRLGLPDRLGTLIAVGTSICGNTAIVAVSPTIGAKEEETSYAVACITIFGLLAMFTYPWIAHAAFGTSPMLAGIFLGTSIHDTSQVAGASLMYQETFSAPLALQAATVTKLLRNMSMAVLIPLIATRFRADRGRLTLKEVRSAVPGFVFLFLGAIALRTLGDAALGGSAAALVDWKAFLGSASTVSTWALTIALAGIGLSTELAKLRGLGLKPLLVGFAAALSVGVVSYLSLSLLAR